MDPLFAAILANPDDDAPRVVYADALQERGDPRGELIPVQIELARAPGDAARRKALAAVERRVLKRIAPVAPLPKGARLSYRRGFEDGLYVDIHEFANCAAELLDAMPLLRGLFFNETRGAPWTDSLRAIIATGRTQDIERLGLPGSFAPDGIPVITEGSALPRLRELDLGRGSLTLEETLELAAWPRRLRRLSLQGPSPAVAAVAASDLVRDAEELDFSGSPLESFAVDAIARHARVEELVLDSCGLGPTSIEPLLRKGALPRLRRFVLSGNQLGPEGVALVARAENATSWRELALGRTRTLEAGARALAESTVLGSLERLLVDADLGSRARAMLIASGSFPRATILAGARVLVRRDPGS